MAKKKKRHFHTLILLIILLLTVVFIYWQNDCLQLSTYTLSYEELPESFNGYRIAQISDMHGKTFGSQNSELAGRIKALKPDLLLATGDMMSSTINDGQAFLDFLDQFGGYCPVYMCLGNHEQIARWLVGQKNDVDYEGFIKEIEKRGVILLDNEAVRLERGGSAITLEGLTLELYHYSRRDVEPLDDNLLLKQAYMEAVLGKSPKGFTILMAHNPAYFHEYVAWGADLILSGHVHGGVIQVPFKGGLLSPEHVFFPEFDAGLFEEGSSRMIVNRGLGYSVFNFRLFNRPEITLVELKKPGNSKS